MRSAILILLTVLLVVGGLALYTPGRGWAMLLAGGESVEGAPAGSALLAVETIEAFSNEWALLDVRLARRSADPAQPSDKGVPALVLVPIAASPAAAPATRPSQRPPSRPPNSAR